MEYNRAVIRPVALACALLLPLAVTSDDLIRFALSADAHSCCASTNGSCAQLSTPDECCRTQEQAVSQGYATVGPDSRVQFVPAPSAGLPAQFQRFDVEFPGVAEATSPAFKRPHDPPHLHPFPLLI